MMIELHLLLAMILLFIITKFFLFFAMILKMMAFTQMIVKLKLKFTLWALIHGEGFKISLLWFMMMNQEP